MSDAQRRPQAFRLDPAPTNVEGPKGQAAIVEAAADFYDLEAEASLEGGLEPGEAAVEIAQRKGIIRRSLLSWGGLFWSAALGFAGVAIGAWLTSAIENLFARSPALGAIGAALAGLALLALTVMAAREILGVFRQRHIAHMHAGFATARAADDATAVRRLLKDLEGLYTARPETAAARADLTAHRDSIIDGRDLCDMAEHALMRPLDAAACGEIASAAKRVSIVTTFAPRAILDVIFVAAQALRLIRRIAEIYGGRPGLLGLIKLMRAVAVHLAITANMAVGDSLIQQVVGHGIAAKLSARLGESLLNGMLTARVGLSAMAVCRPLPFAALKQPSVRDVAPFLFKKEG
jgi:putative membrane protein